MVIQRTITALIFANRWRRYSTSGCWTTRKLWMKRAHDIFAQDLWVMRQTKRMYLWFTWSHSRKCREMKYSPKMVTRSPETRAFSGATFLRVFLRSAKCSFFFSIFLKHKFLIFLAVWLQMISRWQKWKETMGSLTI